MNYGRINGENFHTDCAATVTVSRLHIADSNLSTSHVYLGEHKRHPEHIPFALHRTA